MNSNKNIENIFINANFYKIINIFCKYIFLLLLIITTNVHFVFSQETNESNLIAAYLERFTRFIENKTNPDFDNPNKEFILYFFGDTKYKTDFENIFDKQKIKNRSVRVKFINNTDQIDSPDMIFIFKTTEINLNKIIDLSKKQKFLTTSYTKGYAKKGVHINLYMQDQKLKFEINQTSSKESGFNISHLLLSKAVIIE